MSLSVAEILEKLEKLGVTNVRVNFSGGGDSGDIDNVEVTPSNISLPQDVHDSIVDLTYDALPGGWEINEGSQGAVDWDVASEDVTGYLNWNEYQNEEEITSQSIVPIGRDARGGQGDRIPAYEYDSGNILFPTYESVATYFDAFMPTLSPDKAQDFLTATIIARLLRIGWPTFLRKRANRLIARAENTGNASFAQVWAEAIQDAFDRPPLIWVPESENPQTQLIELLDAAGLSSFSWEFEAEWFSGSIGNATEIFLREFSPERFIGTKGDAAKSANVSFGDIEMPEFLEEFLPDLEYGGRVTVDTTSKMITTHTIYSELVVGEEEEGISVF